MEIQVIDYRKEKPLLNLRDKNVWKLLDGLSIDIAKLIIKRLAAGNIAHEVNMEILNALFAKIIVDSPEYNEQMQSIADATVTYWENGLGSENCKCEILLSNGKETWKIQGKNLE